MARGRLISKSLGSSRKFHALIAVGGKVGEFCQVLFPLIVANTDDFGRMPGDAFTVKNLVLPSSKRSEADFELALDTLQTVKLIVRYEVDDSIYLQVNKFDEHQPNLHKRTASKFPEFPGSSEIYRPNLTESNLTESKRTQNPEENPEPAPGAESLFEQFWAAYPNKKGKGEARKAWAKCHPSEALTQIIIAAVERQRHWPEWTKDGGRFVPHPSTWLNRGSWDDEPTRVEVSLMSDVDRMNVANSEAALAIMEARDGRR